MLQIVDLNRNQAQRLSQITVAPKQSDLFLKGRIVQQWNINAACFRNIQPIIGSLSTQPLQLAECALSELGQFQIWTNAILALLEYEPGSVRLLMYIHISIHYTHTLVCPYVHTSVGRCAAYASIQIHKYIMDLHVSITRMAETERVCITKATALLASRLLKEDNPSCALRSLPFMKSRV